MKQNKWTIIISLPLTVLAFILAWITNWTNNQFWCNVLLGVFGSGLLTFLVAIVNYRTEKRRTLEMFWTYARKAISNLNQYPIDGEISEKADTIILMKEFDRQPLDDTYGEMDFLFANHSVRKRIYNEIYVPIRDAKKEVNITAKKILRLRRYAPDNKGVLQQYIDAIDKILVSEITEEVKIGEETRKISVKCNKIADTCYDALNGFYYDTMYP